MSVLPTVILFVTLSIAADCFLQHQRMQPNNFFTSQNHRLFFRMRRDPPVCATKQKSNEKLQQSILANAFTENNVLQYILTSERESTKVTEECSNSLLNQDVLADMYQGDRAICPFRTYNDVDKQRIPVTITKVECICDPSTLNGKRSTVSCEKMMYRMPVLKFDAACSEYVEATEDIVLACIPVFSNRRTVNTNTLQEALREHVSSEYA